jgi:hypothetical protein
VAEHRQGAFRRHLQREDGKRLIYGGHVISLARALSFNGLANAQMIVALNGGAHANPCFAGDTVKAWSEVLDRAETAAPASGPSGCGWSRSSRARASLCAEGRGREIPARGLAGSGLLGADAEVRAECDRICDHRKNFRVITKFKAK